MSKVKTKNKETIARPTPPPWAILDGALLELWRELEDALKAWHTQTQRPVHPDAIAREGGDAKKARARQVQAAAIIIRQQFGEVRNLLEDYQPATLSVGHRQVRALAIAYLDDEKSDPTAEDDPDLEDGPIVIFANRAISAIRGMREVMRKDAIRSMKMSRNNVKIKVNEGDRERPFDLGEKVAERVLGEAVANPLLDSDETKPAAFAQAE